MLFLLKYKTNHTQKTNGAWEECRSNISFGAIIDNTIPYHENLSRKGFRSLIYRYLLDYYPDLIYRIIFNMLLLFIVYFMVSKLTQ